MATISYKKLWKLLIDKNMRRCDLQALANISSATITKLGKDENVTTDILVKICSALDCDVADIMRIEKTEEVRCNDEIQYTKVLNNIKR